MPVRARAAGGFSGILRRDAIRRAVAVLLLTGLGASLVSGTGPLAETLLALFGLDQAWVGSWLARLLLALPLAVALVLNSLFLARLPRRLQIGIVWGELLLLFAAFFLSFELDFGFLWARLPILVGIGATTTLYVSSISIAVASLIALVAALGRLSGNPTAFGLATFYTSFFRGTPLLLQVYIIYLGLPQLGLTLAPVPSGVIALSLCYGAYMAEIFRAGIESIPRGQWEAGEALGLTRRLILRKIVLPQAIRVVIPPIGNQFIAMLKDSSLVSILGVWELMFLARTQGRAEFRHFEMLIAAALIYWFLSFVFELAQARIERHFGRSDRR